MVAQHHPERSADVVLLVDTFAAEGLDETVRAALALALRQLTDRDRVGLVVFGGAMQWLRLGTGSRQFDRIADALVDIRPVFSWAEKVVTAIPPRMLPVGASILAISPLVDQRSIAAVSDLRRRRYEIGVIEVAAERWAPDPTDEVSRLARRLWEMQRETLRGRLTALGAPVVEWRDGVPLELVMRQLGDLSRRRGRWLAVLRIAIAAVPWLVAAALAGHRCGHGRGAWHGSGVRRPARGRGPARRRTGGGRLAAGPGAGARPRHTTGAGHGARFGRAAHAARGRGGRALGQADGRGCARRHRGHRRAVDGGRRPGRTHTGQRTTRG